MTYLNDRTRIELGLPARLMRRCWAGIIEGHREHDAPIEPSHLELLEALRLCCEEAFTGMAPRDAEKLRARLDRAAIEALKPYEGDALMKTTLMVLYWIRDRVEVGDWDHEKSPLAHECFDALNKGLGEHAELWEACNKSAAKQARKLHERIQGLGYYRKARSIAA